MTLGLGRLKLDPATFWAMSPGELRAAAEGYLGLPPAAPDRTTLAALMRRFPDAATGRDARPSRPQPEEPSHGP